MKALPRSRFGGPVPRPGAAPSDDGEPSLSSTGPALPPAMPPDAPRKALRPGPHGVLDVGSSKVCCMIGRAEPDGSMRVMGHGTIASRGVKAGGIVDIDEAERAIRKAVADAEEMAQHHLRSVTVNLGCGRPTSRQTYVQWPIGGRPVTDADVKRVLLEGRGRATHDGREIVHVLPLRFEVDETAGVADPRNLHCDNLIARLHTVDASATALRNLVTAIAHCELDVAELVSAPLAAGLAALVDDERQLGVTVIDMGGGTTDLAVWGDGQVLHTAQLALGGNHVTHDIARGLGTPVAHAERLKTLYGNAEGSPDDEREMLPLPMVGEEEHLIQKVARSQVVGIIKPRLEETFEALREHLGDESLARTSASRVVLTGGASQLVGVREMAARILDRQVRLGRPAPLRGLGDGHGAAYSTAIGLLSWASGAGRTLADLDLGPDEHPGVLRRIVNFLRDRI